MKTAITLGVAALLLTGGCTASTATTISSPQDAFMASIKQHCGKAYAGRMVTQDSADADMAGQSLVMHVRGCHASHVEIPFHVGNDRSRTWIITRTVNGVRLKHDHRHEDGTADAVTFYGGDTAREGTAQRQEFPVDAESIAAFRANGLDRSLTNVWAVEIDNRTFAYELRRENRFFRVEFDLTKPVATPPAPWGW